MSSRAVLYTRELPGGGYVVIDDLVDDAGASHHARLLVERRADPARRTSQPPVIAESNATDPADALAPLKRIAVDNVALAHAIRLWQARRSVSEG
jgi:hypothetical protein